MPDDLPLDLVRTLEDVRRSVTAFNAEAGAGEVRLAAQTSYWVYDPSINSFAPSKFAGIKGMSLAVYRQALALAGHARGVRNFHGKLSHEAIERASGQTFLASARLSKELLDWGRDVMAANVFDRVTRSKWRFLSLPPSAGLPDQQGSRRVGSKSDAAPPFNLRAATDEQRRRVVAEIAQREGQAAFRRMVLAAYQWRCAITGCDVVEALHAAHILPYRGVLSNHPANGIALRSDLHLLFDLDLLHIDPDSFTVRVHPSLRSGHYSSYEGQALALPAEPTLCPDLDALRFRLSNAKWA